MPFIIIQDYMLAWFALLLIGIFLTESSHHFSLSVTAHKKCAGKDKFDIWQFHSSSNNGLVWCRQMWSGWSSLYLTASLLEQFKPILLDPTAGSSSSCTHARLVGFSTLNNAFIFFFNFELFSSCRFYTSCVWNRKIWVLLHKSKQAWQGNLWNTRHAYTNTLLKTFWNLTNWNYWHLSL